MTRILIVEDSATMRSYVRATLEGITIGDQVARAEVVEASSGFDALRLLPRGRFDLVITDINMPDINGLELIKFVRASEHHREVAVLIISTQSSPKDRERGLALGADYYLAKPFSPETLREAVDICLSARGRPVNQGLDVHGSHHGASPLSAGESATISHEETPASES